MTSFQILTIGQPPNFGDAELMAGLLQQAKFEPAESIEKADVIILNVSLLTELVEKAFFKQFEEVKYTYPYKIIILTGCLPRSEKIKKYSQLGPWKIHHIVEAVEEALHDNVIKMVEKDEFPPLNAPRVRRNNFRGIIPITRGCENNCSSCKTRELHSYPLAEIKKEAQKALQEGVKEIWLTSAEAGSYGRDLGTNSPNLLKELILLPGKFKIHLGAMHPFHVYKMKKELIPFYQSEKLYRELYLPVMAGNNETLQKMEYNYTTEQFLELVEEFRKAVPELTLVTDLLVSYPTETEEQYWETLNFIRKINPDYLNISSFSARMSLPKSSSAKLEPLPEEVIERRLKVLTDILQNISKMQNERWRGWKGKILIQEKGWEQKRWLGRNYAYKPVLVEGDFKLGEEVKVKINKVTTTNLLGEVLKE